MYPQLYMIWYDMIWYDMILYDMKYNMKYNMICIYIYMYIYIYTLYIYDKYIWYIYIYMIYIYIVYTLYTWSIIIQPPITNHSWNLPTTRPPTPCWTPWGRPHLFVFGRHTLFLCGSLRIFWGSGNQLWPTWANPLWFHQTWLVGKSPN